MSLTLNGTSGSKLTRTGAMFANSYPAAIFFWAKYTDAIGLYKFALQYGSSGNAAITIGEHGGLSHWFAETKDATPTSGTIDAGVAATNSWTPCLLVLTSNTSRTMYFGGTTVSNTTTLTLDLSTLTNFVFGQSTSNGAYFGGDLAELALWQGTVPSASDYTSLQGGALPESIASAGLIDAWSLLTQASTQTGVNGRVLTATSTSQGSTHPITRTAGPVLSTPTIASITATSATPGISTDTASGTLYVVLSTANTAPTAAQIKAGQNAAGAASPSGNQAITTTGAKTQAVSGLTASTTYYPFWVHTNGSSVDSSVTAGTSFTTLAASATAVTLTGPTSGAVGVASTNFTVGANGTITGTVTVTPSDSSGGGTFSPTSVNISSGTPTATFTYTPGSSGAKTISVTNGSGLTNPSSITYTVSSVPGLVSSPLQNNAGTLHLSAPFEAFVLNVTTGALVVRKTGLTSNGSTGIVNFTDAALTTATQYRVVWRRTDTGAQGVELLTAA